MQRLKRDTETGRAKAASPGTVAVAQESGSQVTQAPSPVSGSSAVAPSPSASAVKVAEVPVAGRKLWKILVFAAVVLVATVAGAFCLRSRRTEHRLTDKDTIVLSDFDNKTGDTVFDDALKQGLSVQLGQSPFLDLLSDRRVNETLKLMGRTPGDRLTPEITREVCERTGSKAMLTGTIAGLGSQYVIGLKAINCDTGDMLAETQENRRRVRNRCSELWTMRQLAYAPSSASPLVRCRSMPRPCRTRPRRRLRRCEPSALEQRWRIRRVPKPLCLSTSGP